MADVVALRNALASNLNTIPGLRVTAYEPDAVNVPAGFIDGPETIDFDEAMARGADRILFRVIVMVAKVSDRAASQKLDAYLAGSGASSVKAALEASKTLGGNAHTLRVVRAYDIGPYERSGSVSYHGATFDVEVFV